MPVHKFKKPTSPWMALILNLLLEMMTTGSAYANTSLQDTVIGHLAPMCKCLSEIRAMIESRMGKDVFFEIRGVRRSADIMLGLVNRLINNITDLMRKHVYDSIVDGVRDELMLISAALGIDIPFGFMGQLSIACQFRSSAMPSDKFIKLMAIVCAIALTGCDLSQCTHHTVRKTVPHLDEMLETCKITHNPRSNKYNYFLQQIHKLYTMMVKSPKSLGPLCRYMQAASAAAASAAAASAAAAAEALTIFKK